MNAKWTKLLTVVVAVQSALLVGQWMGGGASYVSVAQAQIPDAGAQRNQIIDELRALNTKVDKMVDLMQGGTLQVKVTNIDDLKQPAK
jgi:hypothetical protein